jgi:hypothetical protein
MLLLLWVEFKASMFFYQRNFSNVECCTHQMFVGLIQRLVSEGIAFCY